MKDFFRPLWLRGVTVMTTSNYKIGQLFSDGYNREVLNDFFPGFAERCPEVDMSSATDYISVGVEGSGNIIVGINGANLALVDKKWKEHAGEFKSNVKLEIPFAKRTIDMKAASNDEPITRFDFDDLCGKPLGRSDYSLIAATCHTVFIDNVPTLAEGHEQEFKCWVSFMI